MGKKNGIFRILFPLILIVLIISIIACNAIGINSKIFNVKSETVIEKSNDFLITNITKEQFYKHKYEIDIDGTTVDYMKLIYTEKNKKLGEKYSNVTRDGKIRWNEKKNKTFYEKAVEKNFDKLVTVDDKKIDMPIKFKHIGNAYSTFDNLNFTKILKNKSKYIKIVDIKTSKYILIEKLNNDIASIDLFDKNNFYVTTVLFDTRRDTNVILMGFERRSIIGKINVKFDNIGIGNTLSEMYDKLGTPSSIRYLKEENEYEVFYKFFDKDKFITIYFSYIADVDKLNDEKNNIYRYPNTITGVTILLGKI